MEEWENSDILIESICEEIINENILSLMKKVQVVVDGTDNFETRLILNKACFGKRIPYIYGESSASKGKWPPLFLAKRHVSNVSIQKRKRWLQ